jgi:hypothetical protein
MLKDSRPSFTFAALWHPLPLPMGYHEAGNIKQAIVRGWRRLCDKQQERRSAKEDANAKRQPVGQRHFAWRKGKSRTCRSLGPTPDTTSTLDAPDERLRVHRFSLVAWAALRGIVVSQVYA